MATLKPHPHYEINVKDNSIYDVIYEEILPVHRPVYVLPTQEGPVGEPVWCPSDGVFMKLFGSQTFNESSKYFSKQAFYLKNTMKNNGAFIVRALDSNAKTAAIILEAHVKVADIPQYQTDVDPNSDTFGERLIDLDTDSPTYGQFIPKVITTTETTSSLENYLIGGKYVMMVADSGMRAPGSAGYVPTFNIDNGGSYVKTTVLPDSVAGQDNTYQTSTTLPSVGDNWLPYQTLVSTTEEVHTPVTEEGIELTWKLRHPTQDEIDEGLDQLAVVTNGGTTVYPVLAFESLYAGEYGNDYAFRFFYDKKINTTDALRAFKSVFNSLTVIRREYNSSTTETITDIFGKSTNDFAVNPDAIDTETGIRYDMASVLGRTFDSDKVTLPYTIFTFENNLKTIGERVIAVETPASLCAPEIGVAIASGEETTVGAAVGLMSGYQVNAVTGENVKGVPYNHVHIVGRVADDTLDSTETSMDVVLDRDINNYLVGGTDGSSIDAEFADRAMYRFCKLYLNPKIVDKFRYPFTHMYDVGYSMTTKFAMIDFINIRDDVVVELSTQVLLPNTWVDGVSARPLSLNDNSTDVTNGMVLRERANLMRESNRHNTDCCRVSIYKNAAYPVSATYVEPIPFTFWSAVQHSLYGNRTQMSKQEPRGWPYSYNLLFRRNSWQYMDYEENTKEVSWNAGLNYCQYADTSRIFFPSLRTVYRHDTSVLSDQWVVDAVVYTKHVCRKAWGSHVGRNDKTETFQTSVKTYLETELGHLFNDKYDFTVSVYQTEEEQKIGYIQHVKVSLIFPATNRVLDIDIEVNREGYTPEEA